MTELPEAIEIERLMNLVRGFGWEMEKKESGEEELRVTLRMKKTKEA